MSERRFTDDSSVPDNERSSLIEQVLLTHIQKQLQGEDVFDDDLAAQHPELMPELEERLRLFREMADLRAANGAMDSATSGSDTGMLNVRCPHCRESVRVPADSSLINITCSGCGSRFSVTDENAAQTQAATLTTQLGHFDLVEQIGAGSFGSVWKARDNELDRWVAIKIPRQGKLHAPEVTQFLREARAAAQLSHPNIVSVYEVGREDDTVFIVSDLVQGVSLSDWLTGQQPTIRETCTLCVTIANALHHAHEAGVIHRDLKPQNIMLDAENEPHLLDFGLARRNTGEITMTIDGNVLGTPAYMPPEQARGDAHQVDRRADIYSMGVVLFELLTGELPFRGNARMLIHQMLNEEPPSPRKLNSAISKDLETACLKCLEKEPNKRYASAQEVAGDLQRILNGEAIHARPVSRTDRVVRWCRRNPLLAVLVLVLVTVAIGGPILAVTQTQLRLSADRATVRANEERYVSDMNLAAQAWNAGDVRRTQELLTIHDPRTADEASHGFERFRGLPRFEWRLLWGLAQADQAAWKLVPGIGGVTCLAMSPKSSQVACGGADGSVAIIDLPAHAQPRRLKPFASRVVRVDYSADARWLAAAGEDGNIQLWEVGSWREKATLRGHIGLIRELVFHPDNTRLTSIDDEKIRTWNLLGQANDEKVIDHPEPSAPHINISADATTAATYGGLDNTVRFWRLHSDPLQPQVSPEQGAIILSVLLSPDGSTAFIATHDSWVSRWDIGTLKREVTYSQAALVHSMMLSDDGQTLVATGSDNLVRIWETETGHERQTLRAHPGIPSAVALAADSMSLATVSAEGSLRVRPILTGDVKNRLLHQGIVVDVAVSPNGQTVATTDPNHHLVKLWEMPSQELIDSFEGKQKPAFSRDGKWLALMSFERGSEGRLVLWDRSTTPYGSQPDYDVGSLGIGRHLSFSHNSKILAFRGKNDAVTLWDVDKREVMCTLPEHSETCATAFGAGDKVIATASDGWVRIWDVASGRLLAPIPDQGKEISRASSERARSRWICFSPTGDSLAATSGNTELRWWDVSSPMEPSELPPLRGHTDEIHGIAFSPDGTMLATGSYDGTLRLWDVAGGRQLAMLRGHSSVIESLAWSLDGNTIYTGSGDASCRIWHAPSWAEIEADEAP